MGRPERPLDPDAGPIQALAHDLRTLRHQAGSPAYRAMARHVGVSVTSLSQAAAGQKLPSLGVALAYVRACGGDEAEWESRWKQAACEAPPSVADDRDECGGEAPYRGLARFEAADRELFFGRDRFIEELRELLCEQRFAALFGASGSGKSSLLRAGLVPLVREYAEQLGRPAVVRILTPGERPATTFGHLLAPRADEPDSWVVVDQFEEVFTLCRDREERIRFIDLLLAAQKPDSRLRAVIAMRADFYGLCAQHPDLAEALRRGGLLLGPMSAGELREAVTGPAAAAGLVVERRLTTRIVEEVVDQPGGLPMLSHALLETWRRRRGRILTLEAYEAAGGVHGAIAATAERVYERLTPDQARAARRLLLRLISLGEGTADTRRAVERAELDEWLDPDVATVIERLAAARLLTIDGETVELAHEALIGCWPRLRGWIEQDRDRLRQQRLLGEAAHTWRQLERDPGALYHGARLNQAAEAFARPDHERELTTVEREFLTASREARDRELRSAAHARRRRRGVRATLSALLAVVVCVSLVAWQQNSTNVRESDQATALRVAEVADSLRTTDPRTAMLLSAAAWNIAQLPETRAALLGSLAQPEQDTFTDPGQTANPERFLVDSGRTLLSVSGTSWHTWSTVTHRQIASGTLPAPTADMTEAGADGHVISLAAVGGWRLWDLVARRWVGEPQAAPSDYFPAIGDDPRSYLIVSESQDQAELRSVAEGRPLLTAAIASETNVATSPDGSLVAICPVSGPLVVRDVATGRDLAGGWTGSDGQHCADQNSRLRFDPVEHRLAAVSASGISVWDTANGQLIADIDDPGGTNVTFSRDGRFLAATGPDEIAVWRLSAPNAPVFRHSLNGETLVGGIAWDPDKPLLRYLEGGTVHTLELGAAAGATWLSTPMSATVLSPDGRTLATAEQTGDQYVFRLVDTGNGHVRRTLPSMPLPVPQDDAGPVAVRYALPLMAFSPDSDTLAYGISAPGRITAKQQLSVWDVTRGRTRGTLDLAAPTAASAVDAIALGRGGTSLVALRTQQTGGISDTGELWSVARRQMTARLGDFADAALALRPDGRLMVGDDTLVTLPNGSSVGRILGLGQQIQTVAFNADGTLIAVGDASGRVALWDGTLTRKLGVLPNAFPNPAPGDSPETVSALAFSPDDSTLAVAGDAGSLQLWDTASRQPLGGNVTTAGEAITALAFNPESTILYASSPHVPLQSHPVTPADAVAEICDRSGTDLTPAQWDTYIPETPFRRVC